MKTSEKIAFALYGLWMTVGLVLTACGYRAGPWGDFILIALAGLNLFLFSRAWGWFFLVVAASAAVETLGTRTGFPFGPYGYTGAFGPRLGGLPLAIPLAWYVLLTAGTALVRKPWRVAVLVTAIDWLMEPFAVRIKGYWIWNTADGMPPWENYLAWAAVAFLLALAAPRGGTPRDVRPAAVLGSILLLFIVARVRYGI